jgi:hypothetical protein
MDAYRQIRPLPVSAHLTANGWESTGISYEDYSSMHLTKAGNKFVQRRLDTPDWAMNDLLLREVLLRFLEVRSQGFKALRHKQYEGTPQDRLLRAQKRLTMHRQALTEHITKLCVEYAAVNKAGNNPARLNKLSINIENIDTQLRFLGNEHKMALGVVYFYYRLGHTSVETASALGLKPPHVRMILWRLTKVANEIENPKPSKSQTHSPETRERLRQAALRRWAKAS